MYNYLSILGVCRNVPSVVAPVVLQHHNIVEGIKVLAISLSESEGNWAWGITFPLHEIWLARFDNLTLLGGKESVASGSQSGKEGSSGGGGNEELHFDY